MKMSIFSETFHTILMKYCKVILHTRRVPRVWKYIKIVWMGCEQRSQNEHKIGQKTDVFRLFLTSSKILPYDFHPTFLLKFQISQIHCRTPLRWTVSQRGSHFFWFLGYITWFFLQTLLFLVNAATTFNERGLDPVSCSRFVEKSVNGSSTVSFGVFRF